MNNLNGKNIVISGANTGIGKAVAINCAKEGANIILAVRNKIKVVNLQKQIENIGRKAIVIEMDVTKKETIKLLIDESKKIFDQGKNSRYSFPAFLEACLCYSSSGTRSRFAFCSKNAGPCGYF